MASILSRPQCVNLKFHSNLPGANELIQGPVEGLTSEWIKIQLSENYRKISKYKTHPKSILKWFSSHHAIAFAQPIEARC